MLRVYCDKLQCKVWIDALLGEGFTPRNLAVVKDARCLAEPDLPGHWILKASHGSGWWQTIGPAGQPLDEHRIAIANGWLQKDYADVNHEWAYAGLPRRLIAEERLTYQGVSCPEASVFCFAGQAPLIRLFEPSIIKDDSSRGWTKECFVDRQGELLPIRRPRRHHEPKLRDAWIGRLDEFIDLACSLTGRQSFLRIDGYLSDSGVKVGEITPYPAAGIGYVLEPCWDAWLGSFWT